MNKVFKHPLARLIVILGLVLVLRPVRVLSQQPATKQVDFDTEIQPILARNCRVCHQGGAAPADLRMDTPAALLQGSISGKVIVPGKAAESLLVDRITGKNGIVMPPNGQRLSNEQISLITAWIDQGAKIATTQAAAAPKHWAYVKPVRPILPAVKDTAWGRNAIDRFVLARLEKEGLKPSAEASKETLIRRASLDLIGLPPTPAEVDAFVSDARPDAYERLVDRLLASPRYGERWATPWLDLARYGDSNGLRDDKKRVAWPYRDWVIRALNQNMPFDQFTIEQIAGDMLPNATSDQKIATGFVRSSTLQTEGGTDPEENNWNAQLDRTSTVGTVWLGSTIGCAECHNHKYDPFTQKQFYQMVAFFNNASFVDEGRDPAGLLNAFSYAKQYTEPRLDLPTPEQAAKRDAFNLEIDRLRKQMNDTSPEFRARQAEWERAVLAFENQWQPLRPTRLTSTDGTTLTAAQDGSVIASGKNPDSETYVLDAASPLREITGIRIEALPDPSLPQGGPGRDYYGSFMLEDVRIEAGTSSNTLSKVALKEALSDTPVPVILGANGKRKQIWIVDATPQPGTDAQGTGVGGHLRVQLLLIPDNPLKIDANGVLRTTIVQTSDVTGVNLGRFRVSVTSAPNPKLALDIPAELRPLLSIPVEKRTPQQADAVTGHYRTVAIELAPARQRIVELRQQIEALGIPSALVMAEDSKAQRPSTYVRMRGAFLSKGDLVEADVPAFLAPLPADAKPNRLGLAKWLVSRDNPLTARVTVNHFWEAIFGRGIVETTEDFGTQGFAPSHPDLLDWLAVEFMDNGWNMKAIQRLMVTSSTYRQSSAVTPELLEKDPRNALLSRGPRFRVEAEMIRDFALAASGLLSEKMYGPPVKPPQPDGLWNGFVGGPEKWEVSPGEDRYRRAVYAFVRRSVRLPSLTVFDAPSREFCIARRGHSDTPLQALTTLNDPAFFEAAQAMARRILLEGGTTDSSRATYGFRLIASRKPQARELDTLLSQFGEDQKYFERNLKEAEAVAGKPDAGLAAWTMFSNGLLNLDEALTKE